MDRKGVIEIKSVQINSPATNMLREDKEQMQIRSVTYEALVKEGFTKKFAKFYTDILESELHNDYFDLEYAKWAHRHGFRAEMAYAYGLNESNYMNYLSDYDYYKIWPLNSWSRIWINDKLTLKYVLDGTEYGHMMPKYYYYSSPQGLKKLMDAPNQLKAPTTEEFISLLKEKGEFACKLNNGAASVGFFKLSFEDGCLYKDGDPICQEDIETLLQNHPNYVFTEFIHPHEEFAKYSKSIHTLRLVTINESGSDPVIIGGYIRIPNNMSGTANWISVSDETIEKYNICTDINVDTGEYGNALLIYANRIIPTDVHPDTNAVMKGVIPEYDTLKNAVQGIARKLSSIEYMGFDFGITPNGIKIMEINTHPGIGHMQVYKSLLDHPVAGDYFRSKISKLSDLSEEQIKQRNDILR